MFLNIAARVLFGYIFLYILLRLSGKRTISEATPLDFVLGLILGDLIDDLVWAEVPASQFVVAAGVLVCLHLTNALLCHASDSFSAWIEGTPRLIIRNGSVLPSQTRRERMNEKDLSASLRKEGIDAWDDVKQAWVEKSGEVSVLKQPWAKPVQKSDLGGIEGARR
jgi:uncharacterized membrane protein YcaP (DUF421 family)